MNVHDDYMGSGKLLSLAIKKYGLDNFEKTILFVFDNANDMFAKERELVSEDFVSCTDTYNIRLGGDGGWDYVNAAGLNKIQYVDGRPPEYLSLAGKQGQRKRQERLDNDAQFKNDYYQRVSSSLKVHYQENGHHCKGVSKNLKHRQNIAEASKGKRWMNDGKTSIKVRQEEVAEYLRLGWVNGMTTRRTRRNLPE